MSEMTPKFAIKVLCSAKVAPIEGIHGNPARYGYQNQRFYDMARNIAVAAIKENAVLHKQVKKLTAQLEELKSRCARVYDLPDEGTNQAATAIGKEEKR